MTPMAMTTLNTWAALHTSLPYYRIAQERILDCVMHHTSSLSLASLQLPSLPDVFDDTTLEHITELDLSHNRCKMLPPTLSCLSSLCILNLSYCSSLQELPLHAWSLTHLDLTCCEHISKQNMISFLRELPFSCTLSFSNTPLAYNFTEWGESCSYNLSLRELFQYQSIQYETTKHYIC